MLRIVIGKPLSTGRVSEVVPVAPRADVRAPLAMERLLPSLRRPELIAEVSELAATARALPAPWQRLVSAAFSGFEGQLIYERFVGATLRDVSVALRSHERVLPVDVFRSVVEQIIAGFFALETVPGTRPPLPISDRSVGLCIDGHWRFAVGALNHWLIDHAPGDLTGDPEFDPTSPDTVFFMSPEAISGRAETAASLVSRAALLAWQLGTGGFHPYRGARHELLPSITRYTRDEVRVPLTVNPLLPQGVVAALTSGISFSRRRFDNLRALREALDAAWPQPAAPPERTLAVLTGLTWPHLAKELQGLRREPLLPIRWDGVWSAAQTPEEGLAVLEDQLLEALEPPDQLPRRRPFEPAEPAAPRPGPAVPSETGNGLLDRLISLFRR